MSIPTLSYSGILEPLEELRGSLGRATYPLETPAVAEAREQRGDIVRQLDDYILPRYKSLDAPLLAVVGGSTGSGKSTLVNSLVREQVAAVSAIRPTTRRPLLLHNTQDARWFEPTRILPGLARVAADRSDGDAHSELALAASDHLPSGLALLDSPDIDSVVEENRRLAGQLLNAADLWVFVTSAARYADAIPWALLDEAAARNVVVAVVLNRLPMGAGAEVRPDLARRLEERGLGAVPLFSITERLDEEGFIPREDIAPVRGWLQGLARDAGARSSVARQTLGGAVDSLLAQRPAVLEGLTEQFATRDRLATAVEDASAATEQSIVSALEDGSMLRGEVLERWQEIVGTGAWMKRLESGVSSLRDRMGSWLRGKRKPDDVATEDAIEDSLHSLFVAHSEDTLAAIGTAWTNIPGSQPLLDAARRNVRSHAERSEAATESIRAWQRDVIDMIREEGHGRMATARALSVGVNLLGAALMITIFASTAGLTGGEVAVAGGTAVLAQRLLEAVFGDDAVRRMARQARESLLIRASAFLATDTAPFDDAVAGIDLDSDNYDAVVAAFSAVAAARGKESR